jgi:KUP system potassium uptake protein
MSPYVRSEDRVNIEPLGMGFFQVILHIGFMENVDVPAALRAISYEGSSSSRCLPAISSAGKRSSPRNTLGWRSGASGSSRSWRGMPDRRSTYFKLPPNRVVELGAQIEL